MSNYTKTTDFEAKDSLPSGDSGKIIKGAEFETEFDAISTAIATKADAADATLTGTTSFETLSDGTISVTAFVDEDDMSSDSATLVPTQQSVKAYVDSQVTAQDLDFQADSGGALSIDLDSEALTLTGGTGIDTSGALNEVTFAIDSTVATLTGTQTLTNKTLTTPTISGNLTTDGNIDGRDVATDGAKLDGIEAGATADQTAAEIRTLVDSATDSNVFTDADHTKLDGIEASATADQTDAEIRAAIEAATDSNVFTDADHTKLDGIEALADVTDTTNVTAAGALMDSELTDITAVKALDQGVATTDSPTFAGLTTTADVSFGDNDKAIFGAGSDLQIYHTGTNSIIKNLTGEFLLQGDGITLRGNSPTETMLTGDVNGAITLHYDSLAKLATTSTGIDVTGSVTADGLTVDGTATIGNLYDWTIDDSTFNAGANLSTNTTVHFGTTGNNSFNVYTNDTARLKVGNNGDVSLYEDTGTTAKFFWDASTERLGIGNSAPTTALDVTGTVTADGLTVDGGASVNRATFSDTASDPALEISGRTDSSNLDFKFTDTDGSIVADQVHHKSEYYATDGTQVSAKVRTEYADVSGGMNYVISTSGAGVAVRDRLKIGSTGDISFYDTAGTTAKFFWDASAESLGIGTSSISTSKLHVQGTTGTASAVRAESTAADSDAYYIADNDASVWTWGIDGGNGDAWTLSNAFGLGTPKLTVKTGGNVGIGTASPANLLHVKGASAGALELARFRLEGATNNPMLKIEADEANQTAGIDVSGSTTTELTFSQGGAERMRIDSSGNLLVAGTSTTPWGNATGTAADNQFIAREDGILGATAYKSTTDVGYVGYFNRTATDGGILAFNKNGTTVGAIGVNGGNNLTIGGSVANHAGLEFVDTAYYPQVAQVGNDGDVDLGGSSRRFKDLYLSNAVKFGSQDALATDGTSNYVKSGSAIYFQPANTTKMLLDANGNLLVGTTDSNVSNNSGAANSGINLLATGQIFAAYAGNTANFNRLDSDGSIVNFDKDGSTVGSIGVDNSDNLYITGNSSHAGLMCGSTEILPYKGTTLNDGANDLGASSFRWKDLYLSGGVVFGTTGGNVTGATLDDYEEGTFTPTIIGSTTAGVGTYTAQSGYYTKIGNTVTAHVLLQWNAHTGTGNLQLTGFPVNPASTHYIVPFTAAVSLSSGYTAEAFVNSSGIFTLYQVNSAGSSNSVPMDTSAQIAFTITYRTA